MNEDEKHKEIADEALQRMLLIARNAARNEWLKQHGAHLFAAASAVASQWASYEKRQTKTGLKKLLNRCRELQEVVDRR